MAHHRSHQPQQLHDEKEMKRPYLSPPTLREPHSASSRSSASASAFTQRSNPEKLWFIWRWVRVIFTITVILQLLILWVTTTRHHSSASQNISNGGATLGRSSWSRRIKSSSLSSSSSSSLNYKLAYDQSYGFFDDISEQDWKRHQERARTAKSHRFMKDPLRFWYSPGWWYLNNYEPGTIAKGWRWEMLFCNSIYQLYFGILSCMNSLHVSSCSSRRWSW